MDNESIGRELRRLAPFHHDVALPGGQRTHVGDMSRRAVEVSRVDTLLRHAFPAIEETLGGSWTGLRVLDVGCNAGGFAVECARRGAQHVLGIDVVERYLEQARFIRDAWDLSNLDFRKLAVEEISDAGIGTFDVTLCFGLLYHLEDPVGAMRRIATVTTSVLVVDTNLLPPRVWRRGPLWLMGFPPVTSEEHNDVSTSLWRQERRCQFRPNREAVTALLRFFNFTDVRLIQPKERGLEKRYYQRRRGTFIARR